MGFIMDLLKELKKIRGVEEAYTVYGVYDLIAKVQRRSMNDLKNTVNQEIRKLVKVQSTLTMIVSKIS